MNKVIFPSANKVIFLLLLLLISIFPGCTTQPPSQAYTPTPTPSTPTPEATITPAYDIRFDNFAAYTDGKIKFRVFGKSSYALSDLKWVVNGVEIKDYSKIIVGYQEDIGTANTMIRGAAEGEPIYIKTGQSWGAGAVVSILIVEKQSGIVLVEKNLFVQEL
ncbi:MAG: hypothetical protein QXJ68_04085 [Methanocellales archaeon]